MTVDSSLWVYFSDAGTIVKCVLFLLLAASIISWTLIFQKGYFIKRVRKAVIAFEDKFSAGGDLTKLYSDDPSQIDEFNGIENIFRAGFSEFMRTRKQNLSFDNAPVAVEAASRAMRIVTSKELDKLELHLPILATIGSTSPYIGLFGTVWGIMSSFHALGGVQQATIAMVAPGISEALIATAMGLFAAIPAVIAYNRYVNEVERLVNRYDIFQEEFSTILYRQL